MGSLLLKTPPRGGTAPIFYSSNIPIISALSFWPYGGCFSTPFFLGNSKVKTISLVSPIDSVNLAREKK
tara:strand:- start:444 stop:650 length:207 start_codon:yes stop_codon:yes gene_type:complete